MNFKEIYKNKNKILLVLAFFTCFANIIYINFSNSYLQETGAVSMINLLNQIANGYFTDFSLLKIIINLPTFIAQYFTVNKILLSQITTASYILFPVLVLFASYKLAERTKIYYFFIFSLILYTYSVMPCFDFLLTSDLSVQIAGVFSFLLLVQYLNSNIKYTKKDYLFIGLLILLHFYSSQANILLGVVYFITVLINLLICQNDENKLFKLVTGVLILAGSLCTLGLDFLFHSYLYENIQNIFTNAISDIKIGSYPLAVIFPVVLTVCILLHYTFFPKKLSFIIILCSYFVICFSPNFYYRHIAEFFINIFLPLVAGLFLIIIPFVFCIKKIMQERINLSVIIQRIADSKVVISYLTFSALFIAITTIVLFFYDKNSLDIVFPSIIFFLLVMYMLFDYCQALKCNDKKELIDYYKGSISTLFLFLIYFIFSSIISEFLWHKATYIIYTIFTLLAIVYFFYMLHIIDNEHQSDVEFTTENITEIIRKNIIMVVLLQIIAVSVVQISYTSKWCENFNFLKNTINSYQGKIYFEQDNTIFQDWDKGFRFCCPELNFHLSILLSKEKVVDKIILFYNSESNENSTITDIQSESETEVVHIPWTGSVSKVNKFWDLRDILSEIEKFKNERGI